MRTTPKGTYVEGSKEKAVGSYDAINREMEAGTASRTVAATQMNATSSRAHTLMTITVKQVCCCCAPQRAPDTAVLNMTLQGRLS